MARGDLLVYKEVQCRVTNRSPKVDKRLLVELAEHPTVVEHLPELIAQAQAAAKAQEEAATCGGPGERTGGTRTGANFYLFPHEDPQYLIVSVSYFKMLGLWIEQGFPAAFTWSSDQHAYEDLELRVVKILGHVLDQPVPLKAVRDQFAEDARWDDRLGRCGCVPGHTRKDRRLLRPSITSVAPLVPAGADGSLRAEEGPAQGARPGPEAGDGVDGAEDVATVAVPHASAPHPAPAPAAAPIVKLDPEQSWSKSSLAPLGSLAAPPSQTLKPLQQKQAGSREHASLRPSLGDGGKGGRGRDGGKTIAEVRKADEAEYEPPRGAYVMSGEEDHVMGDDTWMEMESRGERQAEMEMRVKVEASAAGALGEAEVPAAEVLLETSIEEGEHGRCPPPSLAMGMATLESSSLGSVGCHASRPPPGNSIAGGAAMLDIKAEPEPEPEQAGSIYGDAESTAVMLGPLGRSTSSPRLAAPKDGAAKEAVENGRGHLKPAGKAGALPPPEAGQESRPVFNFDVERFIAKIRSATFKERVCRVAAAADAHAQLESPASERARQREERERAAAERAAAAEAEAEARVTPEMLEEFVDFFVLKKNKEKVRRMEASAKLDEAFRRKVEEKFCLVTDALVGPPAAAPARARAPALVPALAYDDGLTKRVLWALAVTLDEDRAYLGGFAAEALKRVCDASKELKRGMRNDAQFVRAMNFARGKWSKRAKVNTKLVSYR
eukprot:jgi/Mesen1/3351/ME000191S02489